MKNLLMVLILAGGGYFGYLKYVEYKANSAPTVADAPKDLSQDPDFKAAVQRSEKAAVKKYPELGKADTGFNARFRNAYAQWRKSGDARLQQPNWPEKLADYVATQPAIISLVAPNGKTLYFDSTDQRDAYQASINRAQKTANAPTPKSPQRKELADTALDGGSLRGAHIENTR